MGIIEQLQVRKVSDVRGKIGQIISRPTKTEELHYKHTDGSAAQEYEIDTPAADAGTASETYSITALGETVSITAAGTTNADASDLADAWNANSILRGVGEAAASGGTVTVTMNLGVDIVVEADGGADTLTVSESTAPSEVDQIPPGRAVYRLSDGTVSLSNPAADNLDALVGASVYLYDSEKSTIGGAAGSTDLYSTRRPVAVMYKGMMVVEGGSAASEGDPVWVGQGSAEEGKFFTADDSGNTRLQISSGARWLRPHVIQIDLPLV